MHNRIKYFLLIIPPEWLPLVTIVGALFEKYVFADWNFLPWLLVLIMLDTVWGVIAATKTKCIESFKMRSFFIKMGMYATGLIIAHVVTTFQIDGQPSLFEDLVCSGFKFMIYGTIIAAEVLSIDESLQKCGTKFGLPPWIRSRMKVFYETGQLTQNTPQSPPNENHIN